MVGGVLSKCACVCFIHLFNISYLTDVSGVLLYPETITEPADINEANNLMPKLIEFGMMNDHPLMMLGGLFNHVCD